MGKRGIVTPKIAALINQKTDGAFCETRVLRLLPYLHYCNTNNTPLDFGRMCSEENEILEFFNCLPDGTQLFDGNKIRFSKKFWDWTCEILYLGYAEKIKDEKEDFGAK
jgi:hypothetical protein